MSACAETSDMSQKEPTKEVVSNIVAGSAPTSKKRISHVKPQCDRQFSPSKQEQLCQRLLCAEKASLQLTVDVLIPEFEFSGLKFTRLHESQDRDSFGLICKDRNQAIGKFRLKPTVHSARVERSLSTKHTEFLANGTLSNISRVFDNGKNRVFRGDVEGYVSFTLLAPLTKAN
jgi:hypothetical protein